MYETQTIPQNIGWGKRLAASTGSYIGLLATILLFFAAARLLVGLPSVVRSVLETRPSASDRAYTQIMAIELAVEKLLVDAQVDSMRAVFSSPDILNAPSIETTLDLHTEIVYTLLREGKDAELELKPEVRRRLASTYMDPRRDPWRQHQFVFYIPSESGKNDSPLDRLFQSAYAGNDHVARRYEGPDSDAGPPIYAVSRGEDGRLELFEYLADPSEPNESMTLGDDLTNLRRYPIPVD